MIQSNKEEKRQANISFSKSGGTAGKNSYSGRVILPTVWLRQMGIGLEDRKVVLTFDGEKIVITKGIM